MVRKSIEYQPMQMNYPVFNYVNTRFNVVFPGKYVKIVQELFNSPYRPDEGEIMYLYPLYHTIQPFAIKIGSKINITEYTGWEDTIYNLHIKKIETMDTIIQNQLDKLVIDRNKLEKILSSKWPQYNYKATNYGYFNLPSIA